MPRSERWIMSNVLEVTTREFSTPITVLIGIESYDLAFHKALRSDHDEQHFELCSCSHRMGLIRRQNDGFPLPHPEALSCNLDVCLTVSNNYKRIEGRGVLTEAFTYVECKHCNRAAVVL
jgi:hypothetical protein